jgi:hypothetical protein
MNDPGGKKERLKKRIVREITDYTINFVYLACFFGVFTQYRRLVLAEYEITYLNYGFSVIEALVLAKLIMIGDILRLGRGLEEKPLIFPTIYKTIVFVVWVVCFSVIEHMTNGLLHGKGLAEAFHDFLSTGTDELLARCIIVFFAFIPFFAFRELGRVLGEGKIHHLFFRRKAVPESDPVRHN